jgi:hypothetical protein
MRVENLKRDRPFFAVVIAFLALISISAPAQNSLNVNVAEIDRDRILNAAQIALNQPPVTITASRAKLSQGGPNDFYSNADYWWPNPSKPDGLPYVERDGQSYPGNFNDHRVVVRTMQDTIAALGAAYKITRDDRYAAKSVQLLRVFFLDPQTRMNPNLQFAQAVPGVSPGRSWGIIDGLHLVEIPKAIEAMESSPAFPPDVLSGLREWFGALVKWMVSSNNGRKEGAAKNNHSVAFYLQIAVFAEFAGDEENFEECRHQFKTVFVPDQMAPDGSFPRELSRTKPYGYSIFQLDNMSALCQVLSRPDDNLWTFKLPDGRGIQKAVEYLYPFLKDKSKWPLKPDVQAWDGWPARQPALLFAGIAFTNKSYIDLWRKLPADPADPEVRRNIAITQPLLWLRN